MNVVIILPHISLAERYNKALARATGALPPLGIMSIGTVLKEAGHNVKILDGFIQPYNEIITEIERFSPVVIGISASTPMWKKVRLLSGALKEKWPNVKIIVGGPHASIIKEEALIEIPHIDAVAWGEGEFSMLEYVESCMDSDSSKPIDGIAIRQKDGSFIIGRDRDPIKDLDLLPMPDRSLIPIKMYTGAMEQSKRMPVTNMITARGCPFKCRFCVPDLLGKGVRYRSTDKVVEEVEYLLKGFGIKDIAFWDDTFTINKKRVIKICERLIEKKLDFTWSAQARADCVTPEMLKIMAKAGCWKLFFGVESLVQKNLDVLKKGESVSQIFEAVKWTKEAGMEVECSFIFGIPGETFKEGLETIQLALKLDPDYAKFFFLALWNREFLQEAKNYGTVLTEEEERITGNVMMFVPFSMSREELQKLYYMAYRKFYFRPKVAYRRFKKIFNPSEIRKSLMGIVILCAFFIEEFKSRFRA